MTPPEAELIARVLAHGDTGAFEALVLAHQATVRRFVRSLCRDDGWADDLAQETFLQAYRRLGSFRGDAPFTTWLLGIAYNGYRNARRKRRELPLEEADRAEEPAAFDANADLRQDVTDALVRLPEEERTALCLSYQQGLSHAEIASATGWPLGTVKTHLAPGKATVVVEHDRPAAPVDEPVAPNPPPPPRADQPVPPPGNPGEVWVQGHWQYREGNYTWVDGHWEQKPQPDATWVQGHWEQRSDGWVFVPGYWSTQ